MPRSQAQYVAVRRLSKRGIQLCLAGWLVAIMACAPFAPSSAWLVLMAWGSVGVILLSPRVGLEIHTMRGLLHWCGFMIVWPATLRVASGIFQEPSQWANPPRSTV